jgi:hypothetical protein
VASRCLWGKAKGRKRGGSGLFIAGVVLENWLGFARNLAVHRTTRGAPCGRGVWREGGDDRWGHEVKESGDGQHNSSGQSDVGPRPKAGIGRFGPHNLFTLFFVLFYFYFSDFWFISYVLQI